MTELQKLILNKLDLGSEKTQAIVDSSKVETDFKRFMYYGVEKSLDNFLVSQPARSRWVIITGLRGVGKTTVLAQLYQYHKLDTCTKFYLSLDELHASGAAMEDLVAAIEYRLKSKIFNYPHPLLIFLDEVHFLPDWALATKILYDNSRYLFLICTGSSAISFWSNPDIGRRAKMISLPPLSFREFEQIDQLYTARGISKYPKARLSIHQSPNVTVDQSSLIQQAIFETASPAETFTRLQALGVSTTEHNDDYLIDEYINFYGSMPYAAVIKYQHQYCREESQTKTSGHSLDKRAGRNKELAEQEIKERVLQTFNTLFLRDLEILDRFDGKTKGKFLRLLLILASADSVNLRKIAQEIELNVLTVQNMLQALVIGEIIVPVAPLGASLGKIAKPYKYLFNGPALRLALSPIHLNSSKKVDLTQVGHLRGRLLEDTIAMYLKKLFVNQPVSAALEYDASSGGADFVIMPRGLKSESMVLEVGYNKTDSRQVSKTLKRFKRKHGIVVTNQPLKLDQSNNIVFIPLRAFLAL